MEDINKTLAVAYGDAIAIMEYNKDFCGCCKTRVYEEWYEKNEAFFVKKGVCLMDNLLRDNDKGDKELRYCFIFDFEDMTESKFSVINYYNREKVADFRYIRAGNDPYNPKITVDYFDQKAFNNLGYFINPPTIEKIDRAFESFIKPHRSLPKDKYKQIMKKWADKEEHILSQFMWEHTIEFIHSSMFYFTLQKPDKISYQEVMQKQPETIEFKTNNKVVKYYYTGYVDLSKSKVYKVVTNNNLEDEKKKGRDKYERHIEKWSVRGHYRNINGKQVWINPHDRGEGTLEKRIYGVVPQSELNLIPKVFERTIETLVETTDIPATATHIPKQTDVLDAAPK